MDHARETFERLSGYLAGDADNPNLLADCAEAALQAGLLDEASALYTRLDAIEPLAGALANQAGIAAMRAGDQPRAQALFARCLETANEQHGVEFNLAWSLALDKQFEASAALLTEEMTQSLPQAAMLSLQIDHELGHFEQAEEKLARFTAFHPDYPPLQAAASVLAMDIDDPALARKLAEQGGDHPDALTTLGTLDLGDRNLAAARRQFEQALATRSFTPRAEVGLGLVELAAGDAVAAAARLDKGAEQFGDHLGSWLAAGWAHFIAGDMDQARRRFETALAHDDTFGEAQGSLAVIELLQGEMESAKRRLDIARRLDRDAFSAALAAILWEQAEGRSENARKIFEKVASQPILPNGSTLMDELVKAMGAA